MAELLAGQLVDLKVRQKVGQTVGLKVQLMVDWKVHSMVGQMAVLMVAWWAGWKVDQMVDQKAPLMVVQMAPLMVEWWVVQMVLWVDQKDNKLAAQKVLQMEDWRVLQWADRTVAEMAAQMDRKLDFRMVLPKGPPKDIHLVHKKVQPWVVQKALRRVRMAH